MKAARDTSPTVHATRAPVVVVVGHIDHGKSTLLDYIRHTQTTENESGGITQHLSAYEATHETPQGPRTITFLDTPGHEAFSGMRSRGLSVADVAVLVISAEDGVKPQTLEALKLIGEANIPYIVAFTKIDKESAALERAKASCIEHGIYLEGMGGDIPYIGVSGKTGEGVPDLLDLILLAADLRGLSANPVGPAEGVVIESHIESRRGASATLIIKNGTLASGQYVVAGEAVAPVRIMENFLGQNIKQALPGEPVRIVGFSAVPKVGSAFRALEGKKEAEEAARLAAPQATHRMSAAPSMAASEEEEAPTILPIVIKTDTGGTNEAVLHELHKLPTMEKLHVRIVSQGVGSISESDVQLAVGELPGLVVGFNVKVDKSAEALAERLGVTVGTFSIIYELAQWLGAEVEKRRPRERVEEQMGVAHVIKIFSTTKRASVLGGRVDEGALSLHASVNILRRDLELGQGVIESLQSQRAPVPTVEKGHEFGAQIKTAVQLAPGDRLEAFTVVTK